MSGRINVTTFRVTAFCAVIGASIWLAGSTSANAEHSSQQDTIAQSDSSTKTKDITKGVELLKKAADRGDADAETKLGILYSKVGRDSKKAAELYQKAANQGFAAAQFHLAGLYEKGDGVTKDFNRAIDLYQQSANGGYAPAQFYLGLLYQSGNGVLQNPGKAAEMYQRAANQGYPAAQMFLASFYEKGTGVPKNIDKAVELYRAAADQGDAGAAVYLGSMYQNGNGVAKDLAKAAQLYQKAANQGDAEALLLLAHFYKDGVGVPQDLKKATELYQQVADHGSPPFREIALENLKSVNPGASAAPATSATPKAVASPEPDDCEKKYEEAMSYNSGMNHVHINSEETIKRLKRLANEQCPEALARLAMMAEEGNWTSSVPKDDKSAQEAAKIALAEGLAKRADDGRPHARYLLGVFYAYGLGVAEDFDKSWDLRVDAAKHGCSDAQFWVGSMCERYNQPAEAAYWYQKSADQGDAWSQLAFGLLYKKGLGVSQDTKKAAQLIGQAANQGLEEARAELKKIHVKPATTGTQRSPVPATEAKKSFSGTWTGTVSGRWAKNSQPDNFPVTARISNDEKTVESKVGISEGTFPCKRRGHALIWAQRTSEQGDIHSVTCSLTLRADRSATLAATFTYREPSTGVTNSIELAGTLSK